MNTKKKKRWHQIPTIQHCTHMQRDVFIQIRGGGRGIHVAVCCSQAVQELSICDLIFPVFSLSLSLQRVIDAVIFIVHHSQCLSGHTTEAATRSACSSRLAQVLADSQRLPCDCAFVRKVRRCIPSLSPSLSLSLTHPLSFFVSLFLLPPLIVLWCEECLKPPTNRNRNLFFPSCKHQLARTRTPPCVLQM